MLIGDFPRCRTRQSRNGCGDATAAWSERQCMFSPSHLNSPSPRHPGSPSVANRSTPRAGNRCVETGRQTGERPALERAEAVLAEIGATPELANVCESGAPHVLEAPD